METAHFVLGISPSRSRPLGMRRAEPDYQKASSDLWDGRRAVVVPSVHLQLPMKAIPQHQERAGAEDGAPTALPAGCDAAQWAQGWALPSAGCAYGADAPRDPVSISAMPLPRLQGSRKGKPIHFF